jgi:hypothetical protein
MSAYLVGEDHLDLLASAVEWNREGLFVVFYDEMLPPRSDLPAERGEGNYYKGEAHASLIKDELRAENKASLWARYPKDANLFWEGREDEPYCLIMRDQATTAQILGALACYEYQACESENWRNSYAFAICQAIRRAICSGISNGAWDYERPANLSERVRLI